MESVVISEVGAAYFGSPSFLDLHECSCFALLLFASHLLVVADGGCDREVILAVLLRPRDDSSAPSAMFSTGFAEPSFSDAAGRKNPLVPARTCNHRVDFRTVVHHDEACGYRWPPVREVDGEGAGAVGVHRVSSSGRSVGEVGDNLAVDRDRIDLSEVAFAVKLAHRHAHLWASGSHAPQLGALDGESIVALNEFVVAGWIVTLRVSRAQSHERQQNQRDRIYN